MRKWGPAVIIAVVLGALFVWSQCGGPGSSSQTARTQEELIQTAAASLKSVEPDWQWDASDVCSFDVGTLSPESQSTLNKVTDSTFAPPAGFLADLDRALGAHKPGPSRDGGLHDWLLVKLAVCRAALASGNAESALASLLDAASRSESAIATATTIDEWQQAQAARLRFLDLAPVILQDPKWGSIREGATEAVRRQAQHRSALGRVVQRRFLTDAIPAVAVASSSTDIPQVVVDALYTQPNGDEHDLVAAMLRGHSRSFNPDLTVVAGAESVQQLRDALARRWSDAREVLDNARKSQKFWSDFRALLDLEEAQAVERVKELKKEVDQIENPVGLALLDRERSSWSGLVQSAYVADAREVAFQAFLLHLHGATRSLTDPFSGEAFEPTGDAIQFRSDGRDSEYPFVQAFTSSPFRFVP
jgi:hypothetical protein